MEPSVLVVEDDPAVLRAIVRLLRANGYSVCGVATASAALRQTRAFHAGVFDIEVGADDGVEVARTLLGRGRVRHAVFYSGCTTRRRLAPAHRLGTVVQKGSGPSALLRVMSWLHPSRVHSGVRLRAKDPEAQDDPENNAQDG